MLASGLDFEGYEFEVFDKALLRAAAIVLEDRAYREGNRDALVLDDRDVSRQGDSEG